MPTDTPRHDRRAGWHDYTGPCFYHFTLRKAPDSPAWGDLRGDPRILRGPAAPHVALNAVGLMLQQNILSIATRRPEWFEIHACMVMPDHMHFIVRVKGTLPQPVTYYIDLMMAGSTAQAKRGGIIGGEASLFEEHALHDRILRSRGQLARMRDYIADNPRRSLIKRMRPDLFTRIQGLRLGEWELEGLGNPFLLRSPWLVQVHVRSFWKDAEWQAYRDRILAAAAAGAVLVSPFISPREREIEQAAVAAGAAVVRLRAEGFGRYEKPMGREFELCAQGRLLLLAERGSTTRSVTMTRATAQRLNYFAAQIAAHALTLAIQKPPTPPPLPGQ